VQLTFLVTSPRVAPGLMSWGAWQAISAAGRVCASDDTSPVSRAVTAAGHRVDVLPAPSAAGLLAQAASADSDMVWLATDEESVRLTSALAAELVADSGADTVSVEVLHGSYDVPGARLLDLVAVMDRLRQDCPWDREQTHRSLAKYLLEETYETLEAIESTGGAEDAGLLDLREELGDLLLQVVFHARIAAEDPAAGFTIDDVAGGIVEKLVHRHPHVFAGLDVAGVGEVESNWETLKAAEKGRASVLDGIPLSLPALALADKVLGRAGSRVVEPDSRAVEPVETTLGDRLLDLVVDARSQGLDAEQELRDAVRRLADYVRAAERS